MFIDAGVIRIRPASAWRSWPPPTTFSGRADPQARGHPGAAGDHELHADAAAAVGRLPWTAGTVSGWRLQSTSSSCWSPVRRLKGSALQRPSDPALPRRQRGGDHVAARRDARARGQHLPRRGGRSSPGCAVTAGSPWRGRRGDRNRLSPTRAGRRRGRGTTPRSTRSLAKTDLRPPAASASLLTSSSFCGVPSGLLVSHRILALEPDDVGDDSGDLLDHVVSCPVPTLTCSRSVVVLHQVQAGVGHVVDVKELAAESRCPSSSPRLHRT